MATPVSRLFNGSSDWIRLPFGLGFGSSIQHFTIGMWIQSGDTSGTDKALLSAEAASSGAASNVSLGFYWNNGELGVKYYYRPPGSPSDPGVFEEKFVSYSTPADTPVFVAVVAEGDAAAPGATPTFRFYAGTTPENIVQVGTDQVASGAIKSNNRKFAVGARTTGSTPTADANYFPGNVQRVGYFNEQAYTLDQLKRFAATSAPMLIDELEFWGFPQGQVFEFWGDDPELDHSLNNWSTDLITGTTTDDPIAPTPWSQKAFIGDYDSIDFMIQLSDGSILASARVSTSGGDVDMYKSTDGGANWTLKQTLVGDGLISIEQMVELDPGVVLGTGFAGGTLPYEVWRSEDYGETWDYVSDIDPDVKFAFTLLDLGGGEVLVGTRNDGEIYRTTDYGDTWTLFSAIPIGVSLASKSVTALIDLGGGVYLAANGLSEIFRSTNSGVTWSGSPYSDIGDNANTQLKSMGGGVILAATALGNLWYSDDDGATWTKTYDSAFYLDFYQTQPDTIFPTFGNCMFAVTISPVNFILGSTDGGQTWGERVLGNTRVAGPALSSVMLDDNTWLLSGDEGAFTGDQVIYELDVESFAECASEPEIRVVNERRIVAWTNPCANQCCDAPDPGDGPNVPPRPPPAVVKRMVRDVAQLRIEAWTDVAADPPGAVNVTRVQKLIEYRETPRDTLPPEEGEGEDSSLSGTCSLRVRLRIFRVEDLVQVFELDQYARLEYTRRWTEMDDFVLKMSADTLQAREMIALGIVPTNGKYILGVFIEGLPDFAGFIDNVTVEITNRGEHIWTLRGLGVDRVLSDRIILPPSGQAYDRYEGRAETIMKSLVNRQMVTPITTGITNVADADRAIPQLVIAPDSALGSIVKLEGRFQKVQEALLQISRSSNDIGFGVKMLEGVLIFEVHQGTDRSRQCVLAVELDNLGDFTLDQDGTQFSSHVIMAGTGEEAARVVIAVSTETSTRVGIERRESFQDARDLDTPTALNDKGIAFLQERGLIVTLAGNKLIGTFPCYRRDFVVGDFVTIRNAIYDYSQVNRVMEARVTVEGGRLEQCDLVFAKPRKDPIKFMRTSPQVTASSRV